MAKVKKHGKDLHNLSSLDDSSSDGEKERSNYVSLCLSETQMFHLFEFHPEFFDKDKDKNFSTETRFTQIPDLEYQKSRSIGEQKHKEDTKEIGFCCYTNDLMHFDTNRNDRNISACNRIFRSISQQKHFKNIQQWYHPNSTGNDSFTYVFQIDSTFGKVQSFHYVDEKGIAVVAYSQPDNEYDLVSCWSIKNLMKPENVFKVKKEITYVQYLPKNATILSIGTSRGFVEIWSITKASHKRLYNKNIDDEASKITGLKCITNQIFASSLHGKLVKITVVGESASMETVCNTPVWSKTGKLERLCIISFDISSNKLLIGTDIGLILMYDLDKDYREYSVFEGHQNPVTSVFWSLKYPNKFVSFCSSENHVMLWLEENSEKFMDIIKFQRDQEIIFCNVFLNKSDVADFYTTTKSNVHTEWQIDNKKNKLKKLNTILISGTSLYTACQPVQNNRILMASNNSLKFFVK